MFLYENVLTENLGRFDRKWSRFGLGSFSLASTQTSEVVNAHPGYFDMIRLGIKFAKFNIALTKYF